MSGANSPRAAVKSHGRLCASAAPDFSELWKNVSKLSGGKTQANRSDAPTERESLRFTELQSPTRRGGRFPGVSNADSPGDVEPSQDIIWDPTSPNQPKAGFRYTKVEIADLVNRIAPKDVKPQKSPLLQWIGDSAVPCTPDVPKQRTKKRSSRQNSVEDLMKLAKQFDENMQQDNETSEKLSIINNNVEKRAEPADHGANVLFCDPEEAELHALFDSSTQKVSGPLSQACASSARSHQVTPPPTRSSKSPQGNKCDDFDDDWENEILDDSLLMAMTQSPEEHIITSQTNIQSNTTDAKSSASSNHAPKVVKVHTKRSYSALQALCPKPKTTNRSTFKLGPDRVVQPPLEPPQSKSVPLKSPHHAEQCAVSADDFPDTLWDDADDALLYEMCDSVEKISNSQPDASQCEAPDKCKPSRSRPHKPTAPLPIAATNAAAAEPPGAFVRSNSLPVTSSTSPNSPTHGSSVAPQTSRSFPGDRKCLSSSVQFNHSKSRQKSNHTAFKRNVSDCAAMRNKVFVTSDVTGKCSAAEIEKKKQEALARRRQRRHSSQKT